MVRRPAITAATLLVSAVMLACGLLIPQSADAASYRYWTFWLGGSGGWDFSSRGADRIPSDGTVDGWRFAISDAAGASAQPGISSTFDAICADTSPVDNKKRVGLVIDYGSDQDAPAGESPPTATVARCIVVPPSANSYEVLAKVTSTRVEQGLICGISGYPQSGCGETVKQPPSNSNTGDKQGASGAGTKDKNESGSTSGPSNQTTSTKSSKPSQSKADKDKDDGKHKKKPSPGATDPTVESQDEVAAALEAELPAQPTSGSPLGFIIGALLLVGLASGAFVAARRHR